MSRIVDGHRKYLEDQKRQLAELRKAPPSAELKLGKTAYEEISKDLADCPEFNEPRDINAIESFWHRKIVGHKDYDKIPKDKQAEIVNAFIEKNSKKITEELTSRLDQLSAQSDEVNLNRLFSLPTLGELYKTVNNFRNIYRNFMQFMKNEHIVEVIELKKEIEQKIAEKAEEMYQNQIDNLLSEEDKNEAHANAELLTYHFLQQGVFTSGEVNTKISELKEKFGDKIDYSTLEPQLSQALVFEEDRFFATHKK